MEVILANNAGFCFGVDRASKKAIEAAKNGEKVQTLGPLIHNPDFLKHLESKGITVADSIGDITAKKLIIRAHGITKEIEQELENRDIEVINATCIFVKKVQELAEKLTKDGFTVIILGEDDHPEVIGLKSYAPDSYTITSMDSIPKLDPSSKVAFISQTTQSVKIFEEIAEKIKKTYKDHKIHNTICSTTDKRQKAAKDLAQKVDLMIIIGGKDSSNTTRLKEVCEKFVRTYHIENYTELEESWFKDIKKVGISAGASTPYFSIEAVLSWLHDTFGAEIVDR